MPPPDAAGRRYILIVDRGGLQTESSYGLRRSADRAFDRACGEPGAYTVDLWDGWHDTPRNVRHWSAGE